MPTQKTVRKTARAKAATPTTSAPPTAKAAAPVKTRDAAPVAAKPAAAPATAPLAAKATKTDKPEKTDKTEKAGKPEKAPKLRQKPVRDSFTMPEADFSLVATLKARALAGQRETKKSELLRAGLHALAAMDGPALLAALQALEPIKTGRPKKGH